MNQKRTFTDSLGRTVTFNWPPQRIISLCPSQTETLIELSLPGKVVGRTRFCIHPKEKVHEIVAVGGTKEIKMDRIRALKPDLIIGEKEENTPEMVEEMAAEFPVYLTDVVDIDSAIQMIRTLAKVCGGEVLGKRLAERIESNFNGLKPVSNQIPAAYFIWREPWMVAGRHTFIQSLLQACGLQNVCLDLPGRYPQTSLEQLRSLRPKLLLLSSEPYPFAEKHFAELKEAFPEAEIRLLDGEMFSWYGIRMLKMPDYLNQLLGSLNQS